MTAYRESVEDILLRLGEGTAKLHKRLLMAKKHDEIETSRFETKDGLSTG